LGKDGIESEVKLHNAFDFGADRLPHFMLTLNAMLGMGSYGGKTFCSQVEVGKT
jgi:hypothetical protein